MARSKNGSLLGKAAQTNKLEIMRSLTPSSPLSFEEHLELMRNLRSDEIRLARSWKDIPLLKDCHINNALRIHGEILEAKAGLR